ncbi:MAG TPA: histidine kinase [Thermoleophilaceae bacterium]|jgi:signal transduction histidine kinase|nr:histidine kinase [Thermoleophilaceae bacterium]
MRRRLRGLTARDWRVIDRVLVGVLFVVIEVEVITSDAIQGPRVLNGLLLGAVTLSFLWRRSHPEISLAAVLAGLVLSQLVLTPPPDLFAAVVMLISASYAAGAHLEGRRALIGLVGAVVTVSTVALIYDSGDVFFPVTIFCCIPWLVGRTLRNHTALARELAEKAERAEHERAEEERRAIAAERSRIARELHDVLAHSLSVMVVQSGAARRIVERDPEKAAAAAELVRETGREALAELRHLFGPVRRGEGEALSGPPSIRRVEDLVERARAAGLAVRLVIDGEPVDLPTGVDLTAYRVVQEALTNTLKHAGRARATVRISYELNEVVLSVEDDGGEHPGAAAAEGGGYGLVGMRERVAVYGGVLQAGPHEGSGFAVRVRLPTRPLVPA